MWAHHFQEVLNKEVPEEPAMFQDAKEDLYISTEPHRKEEVMKAIGDLKNDKATGQDQSNAELPKGHPELAAGILLPRFTKLQNADGMPTDRSRGVIITVFKKGTLSCCNKGQGITLLSLPSKTFFNLIQSP